MCAYQSRATQSLPSHDHCLITVLVISGEAGGHSNSTFIILKSSMSLDTANIEVIISTALQINIELNTIPRSLSEVVSAHSH